MAYNHSHGLIYLTIAAIALTIGSNIKEVRRENKGLRLKINQLEQSYSALTNQYAQAHSTTNVTRTISPSPLTSRAVDAANYANRLNQAQATGVRTH